MKKMGKNKAPSADGMMDTIFQEEEWKQILFEGEYGINPNDIDRKERIRHNLSLKLRNYLNHILENKRRLPFKQNLLEQIYIPKDES